MIYFDRYVKSQDNGNAFNVVLAVVTMRCPVYM